MEERSVACKRPAPALDAADQQKVSLRRNISSEDPFTFEDDVLDQVRVYDCRFDKDAIASRSTSRDAQTCAFGKRDGTGVEAVNDVMPTEAVAIRDCVRAFATGSGSTAQVKIIDFGCGDGRYLAEFLRISKTICPLRVLATEISAGGLRSFQQRAKSLGGSVEGNISDVWSSSVLRWSTLEITLLLSDPMSAVEEVETRMREALDGDADVVVSGWGTISSIPPKDGVSRQEAFIGAFCRLGRSFINVVSNKRANHLVPQRRFNAMREAYEDPCLPAAAKKWLARRLRMAVLPHTYYYPVGSGAAKEWLFYSGVSEHSERSRLIAAGFSTVDVRICNIINFFHILTQPRAAKINAAVIALLAKGRVYNAQLLLSKLASKAFGLPLHEMRTSPLFDDTCVKDQVSRYFISVSFR